MANPSTNLEEPDEVEETKPKWRYLRGREKPLVSFSLPVPQTDTGERVENTQARERTLAKELGKIAP